MDCLEKQLPGRHRGGLALPVHGPIQPVEGRASPAGQGGEGLIDPGAGRTQGLLQQIRRGHAGAGQPLLQPLLQGQSGAAVPHAEFS